MSTEQAATANNKRYYQVFNGAFRTKVPEGTFNALERVNKNNVRVFEREVKALFGLIENISLEDSDYGKQIKITLDTNDEGVHPILSFGVESKDGRDILKKLPAVDFSKEVRIMPYRFKPEDKDEEISGISITQQDEEGKYTVKIENFFFDPDTQKYIHNYPTIDWDKASESEKKIYKIKRDEFLVQYLINKVIPTFSDKNDMGLEAGFNYPDEEINPEEIPF